MKDQSPMLNQLQLQMHMVNQPPPPPNQQQQQQQQQPLMGPTHSQSNIQYPPPPPWSLHTFPPNPNPNPNLMFPKPTRPNWNNKGKKPIDRRNKSKSMMNAPPPPSSLVGSTPTPPTYHPPALYDLEHQNRLKARRFYHPKKTKFNRMAPYAHAPRNTTSFLIRAKKSGGIASLVSPCPVTPAVLPTPVFSPSREALVDMAKEEWGVDGYGSMKGFIRLRSPGHDDDYDDDYEGGSSESDVEEQHVDVDRRLDHHHDHVEEHVEVERRLDHDLSRFEMIYPNNANSGGVDYHNVFLENRVDDQDTHIAHLEDENLILKERLYLMERELGELRQRLLCLERHNHQVVEDINEEVVENDSHEGLVNVAVLLGGNDNKHNEEVVDYVPRDDDVGDSEMKRDDVSLDKDDAFEGLKANIALAEEGGKHDVVSLVNKNEEQVEGRDSNKKNVGLVDDGGTQVPNVEDACMGRTVAVSKQARNECDDPEDLHMETDKDKDEDDAVEGTGDIGSVKNVSMEDA